MPAEHDIAAETELWDAYAESAFRDDAEPTFRWTQYAGHGPGPGPLDSPGSVLEIGCGTGRALAFLAERGVRARGVDLSPVMVKKSSYDAIYSIFGAAWFTDPSRLVPLVRQRLNPGGVGRVRRSRSARSRSAGAGSHGDADRARRGRLR